MAGLHRRIKRLESRQRSLEDDPWPEDELPPIISWDEYRDLYPEEPPADELVNEFRMTDPTEKAMLACYVWSLQLYRKIYGGQLQQPFSFAGAGGRFTDFSDEEEFQRAKDWFDRMTLEKIQGKYNRG